MPLNFTNGRLYYCLFLRLHQHTPLLKLLTNGPREMLQLGKMAAAQAAYRRCQNGFQSSAIVDPTPARDQRRWHQVGTSADHVRAVQQATSVAEATFFTETALFAETTLLPEPAFIHEVLNQQRLLVTIVDVQLLLYKNKQFQSLVFLSSAQ